MSPHQIIAVAVRLFAIWLCALVAMNLPYYFLNTPLRGEADSIFVFLGGSAIFVIVAIGLWRFPLMVANKLLSTNVQKSESSAKPDMWLAMGCSLIGLWLLATTIPALVQDLIWAVPEFAGGHPVETLNIWFGLYLPKIIIGVWLILGGKGFRRLFWWARNAGRDTAPQETKKSSTD